MPKNTTHALGDLRFPGPALHGAHQLHGGFAACGSIPARSETAAAVGGGGEATDFWNALRVC